MAITEFFAGIAVADYQSMLAWYERLSGKPPDFFPQDGEAVWHVTEHAWIYGERGLAGEQGAVWHYGESLTVHFVEEPLAHNYGEIRARSEGPEDGHRAACAAVPHARDPLKPFPISALLDEVARLIEHAAVAPEEVSGHTTASRAPR